MRTPRQSIYTLRASRARCPECGRNAGWRKETVRLVRDAFYHERAITGCICHCHYCGANFPSRNCTIAEPHALYSHRIVRAALAFFATGDTLKKVAKQMRQRHGWNIPLATLCDWRQRHAQ